MEAPEEETEKKEEDINLDFLNDFQNEAEVEVDVGDKEAMQTTKEAPSDEEQKKDNEAGGSTQERKFKREREDVPEDEQFNAAKKKSTNESQTTSEPQRRNFVKRGARGGRGWGRFPNSDYRGRGMYPDAQLGRGRGNSHRYREGDYAWDYYHSTWNYSPQPPRDYYHGVENYHPAWSESSYRHNRESHNIGEPRVDPHVGYPPRISREPAIPPNWHEFRDDYVRTHPPFGDPYTDWRTHAGPSTSYRGNQRGRVYHYSPRRNDRQPQQHIPYDEKARVPYEDKPRVPYDDKLRPPYLESRYDERAPPPYESKPRLSPDKGTVPYEQRRYEGKRPFPYDDKPRPPFEGRPRPSYGERPSYEGKQQPSFTEDKVQPYIHKFRSYEDKLRNSQHEEKRHEETRQSPFEDKAPHWDVGIPQDAPKDSPAERHSNNSTNHTPNERLKSPQPSPTAYPKYTSSEPQQKQEYPDPQRKHEYVDSALHQKQVQVYKDTEHLKQEYIETQTTSQSYIDTVNHKQVYMDLDRHSPGYIEPKVHRKLGYVELEQYHPQRYVQPEQHRTHIYNDAEYPQDPVDTEHYRKQVYMEPEQHRRQGYQDPVQHRNESTRLGYVDTPHRSPGYMDIEMMRIHLDASRENEQRHRYIQNERSPPPLEASPYNSSEMMNRPGLTAELLRQHNARMQSHTSAKHPLMDHVINGEQTLMASGARTTKKPLGFVIQRGAEEQQKGDIKSGGDSSEGTKQRILNLKQVKAPDSNRHEFHPKHTPAASSTPKQEPRLIDLSKVTSSAPQPIVYNRKEQHTESIEENREFRAVHIKKGDVQNSRVTITLNNQGNKPANYKTIVCKYWASGTRCVHGDKCNFIHGDEEYEEDEPEEDLLSEQFTSFEQPKRFFHSTYDGGMRQKRYQNNFNDGYQY